MKLLNIASLTSLMLISTQVSSEVTENSQIMPPPGPYQSIMNNTPPVFVPYGSRQARTNPHYQNIAPQAFNQYPADTQKAYAPSIQTPEWVLNRQQETRDNIEKMLKEHKKIDEERKKWIEENNKQMQATWENMLKEYSKIQKQQIKQAENMPDWVKENMLKQHDQQVAMMKFKPPVNEDKRSLMQSPVNSQNKNQYNNFRPSQQAQGMTNRPVFNQPMMPPRMSQPNQSAQWFNGVPQNPRNNMQNNRVNRPNAGPNQINNIRPYANPYNQYPR